MVLTALHGMSTLRQVMATDKTQVVYARVPNAVAEALRRDAADFKRAPATHLRQLLEAKYGAPVDTGNSYTYSRKSDKSDALEDLGD